MDYRTHIDNILSEYCNKHGVEFTDIHCEAFCVKRKDDNIGYNRENTFACSHTVNQIKNKLMESREDTKGMQDKDIKKMLLSFAELLW